MMEEELIKLRGLYLEALHELGEARALCRKLMKAEAERVKGEKDG